MRFDLSRDVGTDAQDFLDVAVLVPHDAVGPRDPHALPVAAYILVDIVFESLGIGANGIHQSLQVAATALDVRHDGLEHVATEDLVLRETEEPLAVFVQQRDLARCVPTQDDAVGVLDQLAILPFARRKQEFGLFAFGAIDGQREYAFVIWLHAHVEPGHRAIGERELDFFLHGDTIAQTAFGQREDPCLLDPRPARLHGPPQQFRIRSPVMHGGRIVQIEIAPIEADELAALEDIVERGAITVLARL